MTIPVFAREWARSLGARERDLCPLKGGINNLAFACESPAGRYVLKGYTSPKGSVVDRMQAEADFLRYANLVAPRFVPKLIEVDIGRRCIVLEHIDGSSYQAGESPCVDDVLAAAEFFKLLNIDKSVAREVVRLPAAEGFAKLTDHLENVRQRIGVMGTEHLPSTLQSDAKKLLDRLKALVELQAQKVESQLARGELANEQDSSRFCVSPSDFGFHNAIRTPMGIRFFDFEFAGWDDPAKALVDFFLQPRVPVRTKDFELFLIATDLEKERQRCVDLSQVLRLKWACIILAALSPSRALAITRVDEMFMHESSIRSKLRLASDYLNAEIKLGLH
jgi:hypothetical protein